MDQFSSRTSQNICTGKNAVFNIEGSAFRNDNGNIYVNCNFNSEKPEYRATPTNTASNTPRNSRKDQMYGSTEKTNRSSSAQTAIDSQLPQKNHVRNMISLFNKINSKRNRSSLH